MVVTDTHFITIPRRPEQVATSSAEQATGTLAERLVAGADESGPARPAHREPDRWLPLLLFILAVVLSFDYHLFGLG